MEQAVKEYIDILRLAMDRHPKSAIMNQSETLGELFIRMFDLRRIQLSPPMEDSYTTNEIEEVEDAVNDSAIGMVYKLNDATFRPLFLKISEWTAFPESRNREARSHRQTTWYIFLVKFFDTLKVTCSVMTSTCVSANLFSQSIVTIYAAFVIDQSVEILNKIPLGKDDSIFLKRQVVRTLHKTFEYDQDGETSTFQLARLFFS